MASNADFVQYVADQCGFKYPDDIKVILVKADHPGTGEVLSKEKMCPVIATYDNLPDWDACIDEIEDYIGQCNKRYPSQRAKSYISRLIVQKQIPGTHDAWAARCIEQGASAAQVKPVHSLDNDAKKEFFLSRIES